MVLQRDTLSCSNEHQPQSETGRKGDMVHRSSELLCGYVVGIKGDCRWQQQCLKGILRALFSYTMFYITTPLCSQTFKQVIDNEYTIIIITCQHIEANVVKVLCIPSSPYNHHHLQYLTVTQIQESMRTNQAANKWIIRYILDQLLPLHRGLDVVCATVSSIKSLAV